MVPVAWGSLAHPAHIATSAISVAARGIIIPGLPAPVCMLGFDGALSTSR
jgi:hypothetical protein